MKKFLIVYIVGILIVLFISSGCEKTYVEATDNYLLPFELQDCKVYYLSNSGGGSITVVRCPNSSTSTNYSSGKAKVNTNVIDGVKYQEIK